MCPAPITRRSLLLAAAGHGSARTQTRPPLRVGAGGDAPRLADALRLARDGDTLHLLPGDHGGDVAVISQRQLRIVGLGEQPVMVHADGRHAEGKALWVVRGDDIQIENIGFSGCRVPDHNGAGIRLERGRLALHGCVFHDNQMGVLTSNDPGAELTVSYCRFSDAPDNPGALPHLLYVGAIQRLTLEHSQLQRGRTGHLLKCRARQAVIRHNQLDDGADGTASYEVDLPNGGLVELTHNVIGQGTGTRNPVMVAYGAELNGQPAWPVNRLTVAHNRFINRLGEAGVLLRAWPDRLPADHAIDSHDNRWLGGGRLELGPRGLSQRDEPGPLPG